MLFWCTFAPPATADTTLRSDQITKMLNSLESMAESQKKIAQSMSDIARKCK